MPISVQGFYSGHDVTVDATTEWPNIHITCTCGWTSTLNGEEENALRDSMARVWIHTGGPQQDGKEALLLDRNMLEQLIDKHLKAHT